jgi:hypothetical protein
MKMEMLIVLHIYQQKNMFREPINSEQNDNVTIIIHQIFG